MAEAKRLLSLIERRSQRAIVGVYLGEANTRRIRGALAPLLRGAPLSKDAVSRLVGRLKEDFERRQQNDLKDEKIRYLYMDGTFRKILKQARLTEEDFRDL